MNALATKETYMEQATQAARLGRFPEASRLLQQAQAADDSLASGQHANLKEPLHRGADLENVVRLAPFRINALVTTGWLNSLFDGRPVNAQGRPIPWFTYPAIDFLEPRIQKEWSVLEWGCGNSTLWWASRAKRVVSVEHDPEWHALIASEAPANATILLAQNSSEYSNPPGINDQGLYDAIVIDGEQRNECAPVAAQLAKPAGIIIFDNSDRKMYRQGMTFLMDNGWRRLDFFGLIPSYLYRICTSIFYRDDAILTGKSLPCDHQSSLGATCAQALDE